MDKQEIIEQMKNGKRIEGVVVAGGNEWNFYARHGFYTVEDDGLDGDGWRQRFVNLFCFVTHDGAILTPDDFEDATQKPPPANHETTLAKIERLELARERIYPLIEQSIDRGGFTLATKLTEQAMAFTYSIEGLWDGLGASK